MTRFRFLRLPHVLVNNSIFHSFREQKVWNWFDINELRDALSASKYIQSLNSDPLVNLGHLSNRDVNWKRAIDVCRFLITLTLGTGRRAGRFEHLVIHFWWLSQLLIVKSIFFYILIFFDFFQMSSSRLWIRIPKMLSRVSTICGACGLQLDIQYYRSTCVYMYIVIRDLM